MRYVYVITLVGFVEDVVRGDRRLSIIGRCPGEVCCSAGVVKHLHVCNLAWHILVIQSCELGGGIINISYLDSQEESFLGLASTVFCQTEVFTRIIHRHLTDAEL